MSAPTWHPRKQILFALLSAADLGLTWWLLDRPDGHAYEANPVANWLLAQAGWLGLASFKAAVVALVLFITAILCRSRPRTAGRLLVLGCACLAGVVCYSAALAASAPPPIALDADGVCADPEYDTFNRQTAQENRHKFVFRALVEQLRREIMAGRITLDQAADVLATSDLGQHPYWVKVVTDRSPNRPLRECFAYHLLRYVAVNSSELPPRTAWKTALRLEHEFQDAYGTTPPLEYRSLLPPLPGPSKGVPSGIETAPQRTHRLSAN